MAEDLQIINGSKEEKYQALLPQIQALMAGEEDLIANLANVAAALQETFRFFWVGFYLVRPTLSHRQPASEELVLGPFQGPVACTRIAKGRGVCGTAWATRTTQIVPDVEQFPGHIACSSKSKSEIVVPLTDERQQVWGVLDIDSESLHTFDTTDARYLADICRLINSTFIH